MEPSQPIPRGSRSMGTTPASARKSAMTTTLRPQHLERSGFRRFEMSCKGVVIPGVVEALAPVGDKGEFHAELFRGRVERARLVAQLGSKQ